MTTQHTMTSLDIALRYEVCKNVMNYEGVCYWIHVGRLSDKAATGERTLTISERCKYCGMFRLTKCSYHAGVHDTVRYISKDYSVDITLDKTTGDIIRG